jgi:hypothetical protein
LQTQGNNFAKLSKRGFVKAWEPGRKPVTTNLTKVIFMAIEYSEKRNFIRMTTDSVITFKEQGQSVIHKGQCINLSAAGVLFTSAQKMLPGTLLDINITPEPAVVAPLNATVQVVRTQLSDSGGYAIAGEIKVIH